MEAIICIAFIVMLWAITFLYTNLKEMKSGRMAGRSGDLNYLYTYRAILQKVAGIEHDLANINNHPYFRSVEISLIRQQTLAKMRGVVARYGRGEISGEEANAQLDEISSRMQVVFFSFAA